MQKTQTTSGGEIITTVYGTEWPVRLGRVDSAAAGAAGRLPAADAPVAEITAFMSKLGVKEGEASSASGSIFFAVCVVIYAARC